MAFVSSLLSLPGVPSARRLREAEIAIFGIAAGVQAFRQYHAMVSLGVRGDEASFVEVAKNTVISSIILIFAYAMLIPNTWRRAWPFVLAIAACPVACEVAVFLAHPEVFRLVRRVATLRRFVESTLQMATVGVLATYGAHLLNTLRVRAIAARQFNQYRLRESIGSGGMGEVHLAEHRLLKRPCAIKLIRPERAGDPRSLERFEREVQAMARLTHPNTVEIFDYGHTEDGTFYYVMEYLPGLSLEGLVDAVGPLMPARVIFFLRQACEALAEAHAAGLIHRDLKPGNLFATRRGGRYDFVKLLDFGLVTEVNGHAGAVDGRERAVVGTPAYMAPEQVLNDRPLDHRCDLYALGAVAYHLLTGRPPFEGESSDPGDERAGPGSRGPADADPSRRGGRPGASRPPLPGEGSRGSILGRRGSRQRPGRLHIRRRMGLAESRLLVGGVRTEGEGRRVELAASLHAQRRRTWTMIRDPSGSIAPSHCKRLYRWVLSHSCPARYTLPNLYDLYLHDGGMLQRSVRSQDRGAQRTSIGRSPDGIHRHGPK